MILYCCPTTSDREKKGFLCRCGAWLVVDETSSPKGLAFTPSCVTCFAARCTLARAVDIDPLATYEQHQKELHNMTDGMTERDEESPLGMMGHSREQERRRIAKETLADLNEAKARLKDAQTRALAIEHKSMAFVIGKISEMIDAHCEAFAEALGIDRG